MIIHKTKESAILFYKFHFDPNLNNLYLMMEM